MLSVYAECHHYSECYYAACRSGECRGANKGKNLEKKFKEFIFSKYSIDNDQLTLFNHNDFKGSSNND